MSGGTICQTWRWIRLIFGIFSANGVGDLCENDADGDGIADTVDSCPANRFVKQSNFQNYTVQEIDPASSTQYDPLWEIRNQGAEIFQKFNSDPGLAIG